MQVARSTLNPIWNETYDLLVQDARQDMLLVHVWNDDTFGKVVIHTEARLLSNIIKRFRRSSFVDVYTQHNNREKRRETSTTKK